MYLGLDIGTSAVKALLVDEEQRVVEQAGVALETQRPQSLWSEQDPNAWWEAVSETISALRARHPAAVTAVRGIGLSGQMHGAVLLDAADRVLRPAILWNDGRSAAQCEVLLEREPRTLEITGNLAMPGFTAPKLLWVAARGAGDGARSSTGWRIRRAAGALSPALPGAARELLTFPK